MLDRAAEIRHGKLRLTVAPTGAGKLGTRIVTAEVDAAEVFPAGPGVALRSCVVAGGLGAHKWADRRLLEQAAAASPDELPLLVDTDGAVLEAARGSVFRAGEGRLATPPADGRILPGITRRQVLALASLDGIEVREEELGLDDLRQGDAFLAGSVRGIEPIRSLDGVELAPAGELSARIAAGLRRRWLGLPQGEAAATAADGRRDDPRDR